MDERDPSGSLELCADDTSHFDSFAGRRLDGRDALRAHLERRPGALLEPAGSPDDEPFVLPRTL